MDTAFVCKVCGYTEYEIVIYQADLGSLDEPIHFCECTNCGAGFYKQGDPPTAIVRPSSTRKIKKNKQKQPPNYIVGCPRCGSARHLLKRVSVKHDLDGTSLDLYRCKDCKMLFFKRDDTEHQAITRLSKRHFEQTIETLSSDFMERNAEAISYCQKLLDGSFLVDGHEKAGIVLSGNEDDTCRLTVIVARERIKQRAPVLWLTFAHYTKEVNDFHENLDASDSEERRRIGRAAHISIVTHDTPFLILEQMGVINGGNEAIHHKAIADDVVSPRYNHMLPTLITTPLSREEFSSHFYRHMTSRIFHQYHWLMVSSIG